MDWRAPSMLALPLLASLPWAHSASALHPAMLLRPQHVNTAHHPRHAQLLSCLKER